MFEAKVIRLERSVTDLVIKLDKLFSFMEMLQTTMKTLMKYNMNTEEYWKTGLVDDWVPMYRHWLTAYKIIDESDLDEEDKKNEKDVLRRCKENKPENALRAWFRLHAGLDPLSES